MATSSRATRWPATAGFLTGVNLPWQIYGCDFGANLWLPGGGVACTERRGALARTLDGIAERGAEAVRWFLFCDGRAGVVRDAEGLAAGVDDLVWRDLDAALRLLDLARLRVVFVVLDFLWFRREREWRGVRLGGGRRQAVVRQARDRLVDSVFRPLFRRYGKEPLVAAWDVLNEPECATFGYRSLAPRSSVGPRVMRAFLGAIAGVARAEATQPVTVGLASRRGLPLVRGVPLDVLQWHWYPGWVCRTLPGAVGGVSNLPVLLGEYPSEQSPDFRPGVPPLAREMGYSGAFEWSALARDRHSGAGRRTVE